VVGDLADIRARFGVADDRLIVVCVSRLAHQLKLEGLLTAIEVVGELSAHIPVSLLIVGDGPARIEVETAASHTNSRCGVGTVILAGELRDPRPAYAVADVALGAGGSALRAMAFGAPLVVQGENGFWELLSPESVDRFKWTGWYGYGDSPGGGAELLRSILSKVLLDRELRKELGEFALKTVSERYSLERAADLQLTIYNDAVARYSSLGLKEIVRSGLWYLKYQTGRRIARMSGSSSSEDFNARPVAKSGG
jgi:L-malate glycosyltransferase